MSTYYRFRTTTIDFPQLHKFDIIPIVSNCGLFFMTLKVTTAIFFQGMGANLNLAKLKLQQCSLAHRCHCQTRLQMQKLIYKGLFNNVTTFYKTINPIFILRKMKLWGRFQITVFCTILKTRIYHFALYLKMAFTIGKILTVFVMTTIFPLL